MGSQEKGKIWKSNPQRTMQLHIAAKPSTLCCHLANTNEQGSDTQVCTQKKPCGFFWGTPTLGCQRKMKYLISNLLPFHIVTFGNTFNWNKNCCCKTIFTTCSTPLPFCYNKSWNTVTSHQIFFVHHYKCRLFHEYVPLEFITLILSWEHCINNKGQLSVSIIIITT